MANTNPLRDLRFSDNSGSSFLSSFPAKIRVLSTDPLVSIDKYSNTRFAFAVWSYDEEKAMILNKGASIARPIQQIDADTDYGMDVTAVDLKITTSGEGKDTRYTVQVLPKAQELTADQVKEVHDLDNNLNKIIKNGVRASEYNKGTELPAADTDEPFEDPFEGMAVR